MMANTQTPFDIAVVMTTVVRPTIQQAIRSVFAQQFEGRIQILVGIDKWEGDRALLDGLSGEKPSHIEMTIVDLGYSTSCRHGGLYPSRFGGSLKTMLSYAANSRYVAYLDDDNWYAPEHAASMLKAVAGKVWAFSLRHFVDRKSGEYLCPDTWESMGPGRGIYAEAQGGFVDTNCYLLDTQACYDVFPEWAMTRFAGRTGTDHQVPSGWLPDPGVERRANRVLSHQARQKAALSALAVSACGRRSCQIHAGGCYSGRRCPASMRCIDRAGKQDSNDASAGAHRGTSGRLSNSRSDGAARAVGSGPRSATEG
jgi:hypothetical protein